MLNVRTAEYDLFKSKFYEQKNIVSKNNNILFIYYTYNNNNYQIFYGQSKNT